MSKEMGKILAAAAAAVVMSIAAISARSETLDLTQLIDPSQPATGSNLPSGFLSTDNSGGQTLYAAFAHQTSGTGVIDPFLTTQHNQSEKGYNTSDPGAGTVMDDNFAGNNGKTRNLPFSELSGHNNADGTYTFLLDTNQNGNSLISLNRLEVFSTGTPSQHVSNISSLVDTTLLYDSGASNRVDMNSKLVQGNGSGISDIAVTFKNSVFSSVTTDKYIILYVEFGNPTNVDPPPPYDTNDGFEEWTFLTGPGGAEPGPEPATIFSLATMATGFGACYAIRRNRGRKNDS